MSSISFEARTRELLDEARQSGTYKELRYIDGPMGATVNLEDRGEVICLCSNNYLGVARHPEVVAAAHEGLDQYAAGTASVRFICGTFACHREIEETIASFAGTEAALTYVSSTSLAEVRRELGMREGFDIGLEMSGNSTAFRQMLEHMCHGGKIAMLGIPPEEMAIDWQQVIFNMLTIKGIYGREMYETWYMMTVLVQGGLDISPVITHQLSYADFESGFDVMNKGQCGKVVLSWEKIG